MPQRAIMNYEGLLKLMKPPKGYKYQWADTASRKRKEQRSMAAHQVAQLNIPWGNLIIILDESHRVKSPDAVSAMICRELAKRSITWLLTGTPAPDRLIDFHHQLLMRADLGQLNNRYFFALGYCGMEKNSRNALTPSKLKDPDIAGLTEILTPYVIRLKQSELVELPPQRFVTVPVDLTPKQAKELAKTEALLNIESIINGDSDIDYDELEENCGHVATYRRMVGTLKTSAAVAFIAEFLEGSDVPLVVFTYHKEVMDRILAAFPKENRSVLRGGQSQKDRALAISGFQKGYARLLVGQIKAAGEGINLQNAAHVVFVEKDWSPGIMKQAQDRVYRIGQKKSTVFYTLNIKDTLDERIEDVLSGKQAHIDALLGELDKPKSEFSPRFAPSHSSRWLRCSASEILNPHLKEKKTKKTSHLEGRQLHEVCENILRTTDRAEIGAIWGAFGRLYGAREQKAVHQYVKYVRERQRQGTVFIEHLVTILPEMKGSIDALFIDENNKHIEVIDLKSGKHIQCFADSAQLKCYALGALQSLSWSPTSIKLTIIQEAFGVDTLTVTHKDLQDFKSQLEKGVARVKTKDINYSAGSWCMFCPIKNTCLEFSNYKKG